MVFGPQDRQPAWTLCNRAGAKAAKNAQRWLDEVDDESYLTCALMADAADDSMVFKEWVDDEGETAGDVSPYTPQHASLQARFIASEPQARFIASEPPVPSIGRSIQQGMERRRRFGPTYSDDGVEDVRSW